MDWLPIESAADFDVRSPGGRRAFDIWVRGALAALKVPATRTDVAEKLGLLTMRILPGHEENVRANFKRAVSAALKRGLRDGWAEVTGGRGAWQKYRRKR